MSSNLCVSAEMCVLVCVKGCECVGTCVSVRPNPNVGTHGLTDFATRSREISKALGLFQCRIPKGVRF